MAVQSSSFEFSKKFLQNPQQKDDMEEHVHVFSEFPSLLMAKLNEQRNSSSMCDVTIITNDRQSFKAHRAVLAASSRFLERELSMLNEEKSEAIIHLGMISSDTFKTILNLMYTSKLSLAKDNVAEVLLASEILGLELKQVAAICRKFLRSHITSKSVARGKKCDESHENIVLHDANNNNISTCGYKRGHSEESSSGVSSCSSSATFVKDVGPENISTPCLSSATPTFVEDSQFSIPKQRPVSLSEAPISPQKEVIPESRPASAPTFGENGPKSIDLDSDCETELVVDDLPHDLSRNFKSPPKLLEIATSSSNVDNEKYISDKQISASEFSCKYKIKSEVQILPEYYPQYQFPPATVGYTPLEYLKNAKTLHGNSNHSQPSHSDSTESQMNKIFNSPGNSSYQQNPPPPFVSTPNRRSYDNFVGNQSDYVDLNSMGMPARKKAKSDDQSLSQSYFNSSTVLPMQGSYQDSSSFWASLYMLRSQALNQVNFFGGSYGLQASTSNSIGQKMSGMTSLAGNLPDYPRRLQHSKSVVTPNALPCKLCRLEFTSEWSLSMHYNLCHPMSLYRSQHAHPMDGSKSIEDHTSMAPSARPVPLMRSTSTPGKIDTHRHNSESRDGISSSDYKPQRMQTPTVHKCYHCKKEFDSIFLLRKHKSTEHMKRPFRCHRCDSAFPNKAGLNVHLRSHTGERPYRCKVCNKAFTQLGHVQRHQKVHTGEKPYECPLCQARVRDKASMHYHILAHQGVKPFQCDQCDARFTKRSSLVKHKNVHTGSFLYQCPQCKASFREKASLSRHVRSQHKDPCFTVSSDFLNSSPTAVKTSQSSSLDLSTNPSAVNLSLDNANEIRVA